MRNATGPFIALAALVAGILAGEHAGPAPARVALASGLLALGGAWLVAGHARRATVAIALLAGSYLVLNRTEFLNLGIFRLQLAAQPMAIQDLLTLYAWLAGVSDPIRKLANVHSKIQRASAAADRICALMDRTPAVADKATAVRLPRHASAIEFNEVTFGYDGNNKLQTITDTAGRITTITHSGNNLQSIKLPDNALWTYTYDGSGRCVRAGSPVRGWMYWRMSRRVQTTRCSAWTMS